MTSFPMPLPVHSAHVGQELEVHYRWHPYFGNKVGIRRVEQRATGQFLKVLGPAGVVVSIADWMLDPIVCAAMTMGAAGVDLAALVELERLLIAGANPADSWSDSAIVREEDHDAFQIAGHDIRSANELVVRHQEIGGIDLPGEGQGHLDAGSDSDAGGRSQRRGA